MVHRWIVCLVALAACSGGGSADPNGSASPTTVAEHDATKLLNPTAEDGRPIMMGFGDHHPKCFAIDPQAGTETTKVSCPDIALKVLHDCRGARLYAAKDGQGCVCVLLDESTANRVECPHRLGLE